MLIFSYSIAEIVLAFSKKHAVAIIGIYEHSMYARM